MTDAIEDSDPAIKELMNIKQDKYHFYFSWNIPELLNIKKEDNFKLFCIEKEIFNRASTKIEGYKLRKRVNIMKIPFNQFPRSPESAHKAGKLKWTHKRDFVSFLNSFKKEIFIETGTGLALTLIMVIESNDRSFNKIMSVELLSERQESNKSKINNVINSRNIDVSTELYCGMSYKELPKMLLGVNKSCVILLDAHPSGKGSGGDEEVRAGDERFRSDYIIREELEVILSHNIKDHVILIDDIPRLMVEAGEVQKLFTKHNLLDKYNFYWVADIEQCNPNYREEKILVCEPK